MGVIPKTKYQNTSRPISGTYTVDNHDSILLCDTSTAPVIINLLDIPARFWPTLYKLYVVDDAGNASANNITINAPTGFTINGQPSLVISADKLSIIIRVTADTKYISSISGTSALSIPVNNTVFVRKNGSDSSGLVERFDKPFLTILAATNATVAAFTSRSQTSRIRIVVDDGFYIDTIQLYEFIDYELGNSVIQASTGQRTIFDGARVFTTITSNVPNCIIYGNAIFINLQSSFAVLELQSSKINLLIHCSSMSGLLFDTILVRTGYAKIYADSISMSNSSSSVRHSISLSTNIGFSPAPSLEVYNAKIYTNPIESFVSVIEFANGNTPNHNPNFSKLMLVDCEVGSWSTTRPAINCIHGGVPTSLGLGELTLKDTLIFSNLKPSIGDEFALHAANILKVFSNGGYANKAVDLGAASSGEFIGNVLIDSNVRINQGVTLTA